MYAFDAKHQKVYFVIFSAVMEALSTVSALVGKLFITGSFNLVYALTGEVFPTMIRNQAFGGCNFIARLGAVSAPYIFYLGTAIFSTLPFQCLQ